MDMLGDLAPLGEFDLIYCQEVLHHTADPAAAFRNLVGRLRPGGELAIYVYRSRRRFESMRTISSASGLRI